MRNWEMGARAISDRVAEDAIARSLMTRMQVKLKLFMATHTFVRTL